LKVTQRKQYVNGKPLSQVHGCILRIGANRMQTTSLVRDGVSSLSRFSVPCVSEQADKADGGATIPVLDIDRLLGILSMHSTKVRLQFKPADGKLVVRSGGKQTTIVSNSNGLAFPNSPSTLQEWEENSIDKASQIRPNGYYMNKPYDEVRESFCSWRVESNDLYEALRCDSINGQRLNRYTFSSEGAGGTLSVAVGVELKGRTEVLLSESAAMIPDEPWEATFEGGLDNVLVHYTGPLSLDFIDFRPEGQGIRVIIRLPDDDFILQAGLI